MASRFVAWLEKHLPVRELIESYAPKNFNVWYYFGVLALVVLLSQFATGIVLAMFYKPGEMTAFDSVEYIMREVPWGWLIRYVHSTGASAFFIVIYLHMFRALSTGRIARPGSFCGSWAFMQGDERRLCRAVIERVHYLVVHVGGLGFPATPADS